MVYFELHRALWAVCSAFIGIIVWESVCIVTLWANRVETKELNAAANGRNLETMAERVLVIYLADFPERNNYAIIP